jgi:predicted nucleic acid-binding protein
MKEKIRLVVDTNTWISTFLSAAFDGGADYLITGDKDLLTLKQYGKTEIVTVTEFENMTV